MNRYIMACNERQATDDLSKFQDAYAKGNLSKEQLLIEADALADKFGKRSQRAESATEFLQCLGEEQDIQLIPVFQSEHEELDEMMNKLFQHGYPGANKIPGECPAKQILCEHAVATVAQRLLRSSELSKRNTDESIRSVLVARKGSHMWTWHHSWNDFQKHHLLKMEHAQEQWVF